MKNPKKYFPGILSIEMEDLKEDLERLINSAGEDFEAGAITEHVFLENRALLKNEILGIRAFKALLDKTDEAEFETLESLIQHIRGNFKKLAQKIDVASAVIICIERKIEKVADYVTKSRI